MRKRRNIYSIPNELNNTKQKSVEEIFQVILAERTFLQSSLKIPILHWSSTMELPRGFRQPKRV